MSHYKNMAIGPESQNVNYLKGYFGENCELVNEMNFVLFSTSGVHGNCSTIECTEWSITENLPEGHDDFNNYLTVLIIRPRLVSMIYGNIFVKNLEQIEYLKKLKKASMKIMSKL